MLTRGKAAALQEIRRWPIEDVLKCLEKNGLGDCCDVFKKRDVVGEVLLELTEGKLALWKRDTNQNKIRALVAFVDDLKMHPEKYLLKESCASEIENLPTRGFPLRYEFPGSSGCYNTAQNSTSEGDKKQEVKGPPQVYAGSTSACNSFLDSNRMDVLPPGVPKPPEKPPLSKRPDVGTTTPRNKPFLEKPSNKDASQRSVSPTQHLRLNYVHHNSTSSDILSQDTNSENSMDQKLQEGPTNISESSVIDRPEDSNHTNVALPEGCKPFSKPPLFRRPPVVKSTLHSKEFPSKPPANINDELNNPHTRSPQPYHVPVSASNNETVLLDGTSDVNKDQDLKVDLQGETTTSGSLSDAVNLYNRGQLFKQQNKRKSEPENTLMLNDLLPKPPNYSCQLSNQRYSSPSSTDSLSWDTDFEDDCPQKEIVTVSLGTTVDINNQDPLPIDVNKSPDEPTSSMKEDINSGFSSTYDKVFLPKPPDPSSKTVENIVSTVNIGAIEARVLAEQLDEEFYESFDGENIADVTAIKKAVFNHSNEGKIGTNDKISLIPMQMQANGTTENIQQNEAGPFSVSPVTNSMLQTTVTGDDAQVKNPDSPPTPPPRNPTMKLNETNAVLSRLHSSAMSLQEETLHQRNTFDRVPQRAGKATSHQSLMISLSNINLMSGNSSYLHSSWNSKPPSEQSSEAEYEILDGSHITSVDTDSLLSEVYESIKEQVQIKGTDEDGYYLQPDPRFPPTITKNEESSSDDSRHFPLPPKTKITVLPDVVLPSAPPPSPPRKKSEDSSSSTTSGSGDSMSGRLGGLFRKVISRPQPLLSDHGEKTPASTPELKKPGSLPPPTTRPPPPVEQRPSAFQRPLPPTPEGKKFQFPSPEKTHNTLPQQTSQTSFRQMPWFHNIDRRRAEELLSNSEDGYFVIRPSTQTSNPLTLTLWYNNRIFNISIRHRSDGKYALGTEKRNEQSFNSIEEIVAFYQSEKLVLYSAGERAGSVLLTNSPNRTL